MNTTLGRESIGMETHSSEIFHVGNSVIAFPNTPRLKHPAEENAIPGVGTSLGSFTRRQRTGFEANPSTERDMNAHPVLPVSLFPGRRNVIIQDDSVTTTPIMANGFGPKTRRQASLLKNDLSTIQSQFNVILNNPVALGNARSRTPLGKSKLLNGLVKLATVIHVNVVEVCSASELVDSPRRIVSSLSPNRESVCPLSRNVMNHNDVLVPSETLHFLRGTVDMVSGDTLTELSRTLGTAVLNLPAARLVGDFRPRASLAVWVMNMKKHMPQGQSFLTKSDSTELKRVIVNELSLSNRRRLANRSGRTGTASFHRVTTRSDEIGTGRSSGNHRADETFFQHEVRNKSLNLKVDECSIRLHPIRLSRVPFPMESPPVFHAPTTDS